MTIVARLSDHPSDAVAAITSAGEVSYDQFRKDIDRAAAHLRAEGIGPGKSVGIHFGINRDGDDYSSWVAHLAALKVGAAHASIHDARSLINLLKHVSLDALIGRIPEGFEGDAPAIISLDLSSLPEAKAGKDEEEKAERLNLTSGTTGNPKLVRWDSATISGRVDQLTELELLGPETCLDSYLSPRTTGGFRYPLAVWLAGGSVLLSEGSPMSDLDRAKRSTLCICSPFQLQRVKGRNVKWPRREERTIVSLGGRVPVRLRDWARENLADKIIISYGSTEAGHVAHGDASVVDRHPGAVGWVRKDSEVQIVGPGGVPVEPGKVGKLRIRTPVMARRSDKDSDGEAEWFEPGDFGTMFEDGLLAIGGRVTDVLNLGGVKLSAADLESRLMSVDGLEDCTAGVVPTPNGDTLWIAAVPRSGLSAQDILPGVRRYVPRGVPFRVVALRAIPRNAMGKVNRRALAERVRNRLRTIKQLKREHA
jgi:acyl-coenzyme A synthetase/AMP-(fatty) acid ligase